MPSSLDGRPMTLTAKHLCRIETIRRRAMEKREKASRDPILEQAVALVELTKHNYEDIPRGNVRAQSNFANLRASWPLNSNVWQKPLTKR